MRINGTLFVVFTFLALFWAVKLMFGLFLSPAPNISGGEVVSTKGDKIQALLTGEFKRQPRKNPVEGSGKLRCIVRDSSGYPVNGAAIRVVPCAPGGNSIGPETEYPFFWEEHSDKAGLVEFRTLAEGHYYVLASIDGANGITLVSVAGRGAFAEAELSIWPAVPCVGEVRANGAPVKGARVVPVHAANFSGDARAYRYLSVITDENGTFKHPLLPEGAWQFLISAAGHAPVVVGVGADGQYHAEMTDGETLSGRVLREVGERPLNNTKVELQAVDDGGEYYSLRSNGQGYFTFGGLRPGDYTLRLAPGEFRAEMLVSVSSEKLETQPAATPLSRNMKIDPLTGAALATEDSGAPLPASDLSSVMPAVLQLKAQASAALRGRILQAGADVGVSGISVALYQGERREPLASAKTDQAGYYHFKSLAPGNYRLSASREDGRVFLSETGVDVHLEGGLQTSGPVLREALPVTLSGQVIDQNGRPLSEVNIEVSISGLPGGPLCFGTDTSGRFSVAGIHGADKVELWAARFGLESAHFGPVTVGATGLQDILLKFSAP